MSEIVSPMPKSFPERLAKSRLRPDCACTDIHRL